MFVCLFVSFCAAEIREGLIRLTAISKTNLSLHTRLTGNINLPWRCEVLKAAVEVLTVLTASHTVPLDYRRWRNVCIANKCYVVFKRN